MLTSPEPPESLLEGTSSASSLHSPARPSSLWQRFKLNAWQRMRIFRRPQVRYALKAASVATFLCIPAFMESTANMFMEARMEWAVVVSVVVMDRTVGGSYQTGKLRILGTVVGGACAVLIYAVCAPLKYSLVAIYLGFMLFVIPCIYVYQNTSYSSACRTALFACSVILLNKVVAREDADVDIYEMAILRTVAQLVGVSIAMFVVTYIWPYHARVQLRKGLSELLLRVGVLFETIMARVMWTDAIPVPRIIRDIQDLEIGLQFRLVDMRGLVKQVENEPRLKGPYPTKVYLQLLESAQILLDRLIVVRASLSRNLVSSHVASDQYEEERAHFIGVITLALYVLASALALKAPLPPYLPEAREAHRSLLARMHKLLAVQAHLRQQSNSRNALSIQSALDGHRHTDIGEFAVVAVLRDAVVEIESMSERVVGLFGRIW
ncbi:hypothetical protein GQ42DRAFT_121286 [Ramicandelaber brevisporus]|nr:hypothetical protein GQ42DRAFT_121286 [Ramicandelaber brevisporus]